MNLQKLQSQREGQKRVIRSYLSKIEDAKENSALIEFDAILQSLESKVKLLEALNEKILGQTDVDGIEEEIFQAEEYSLEMEIKLRQLKAFRDNQGEMRTDRNLPPQYPRENQQNFNELENNRSHNSNRSVSNTSNSQYHRLPKLSLPTFSGNILEWQTFWDSFESTIHDNVNLTDVQKFSYLKSQLENSAARVIDGFAMTNANYARAIDLLKERFGQQHKITHATMQALLQLPTPSNTLHSLRNFYDKMETYIRGLESLGQFQETYGSLLVPIILDKLPAEVRKHLAREHGDNNWQLEELRGAIKKEINIMEAGDSRNTSNVDDFGPTASFYTGARPKKISSSSTRQANFNNKFKNSIRCAFCEESHNSFECRKFVDVNARMKIVREKQLCFNCLGKHQVSTCHSKYRCRNCQKKHHTSICNTLSTNSKPEVPASRPETAVLHSSSRQTTTGVLLKTAVATVCCTDTYVDANILFDEGAQRSFITEDLADKLQVRRESREALHLSSFGNTSNKIQYLDSTTVYLIANSREKIPLRVLIVPTIATPISNRAQHAASRLPYLRGLKLAHTVIDDSPFSISILIGADFYWDVVEDHIVRGDGPTAVKSKIGYLLSGPIIGADRHNHIDHIFNVITSHHPEERDLERFWSLESMGITNDTTNHTITDYMEQYQQTSIDFTDGRYTAKLPWKENYQPLPMNYDITRKRTENTIRRLSNEPQNLKKYGDIIADQEQRGFIEKVDDSIDTTSQVHYIPHHPVKKDSSTTPIRIVYDCSCRQSRNQPSLNDCLESVPPILNELTSILVRFRMHKYAVCTDIEKAFLNVGLHPNDRDVTRFLWLSDPSNPKSSLCTYRFKAVLFGATCSPFILNAMLLKHLKLHRTVKAAETLQRDLYVDNVLSSFQLESEVLTYFREARNLMSEAGMNLRSWTSNSDSLRSRAAIEGVLDKDDVTKVLGMRWEPVTDYMSFAKREIPFLETITKRTILRYSSRIYDPLGLLSPVTVRAKLLLQELWKLNYNWDSPLPSNVQQTWIALADDLNAVTDFKFPRKLVVDADDTQTGNKKAYKANLHIFVDASTKSYGAAAYICNKTDSTLVMAKNRVAPLKALSLPQLELMAALVGARLATHLLSSLNVSDVTLWSDSQIVLYWLSAKKPLKRFVQNRVNEIHNLTTQYEWKYCPTGDNPADLVTRGISADQCITNNLWKTGPTWILDKSRWPKWERSSSNLQTSENEQTTFTADDKIPTTTITTLHCATNQGIHNVMDINKYSSYLKLLHVTGYVLRFISYCKKTPRDRQFNTLSVTELRDAERRWLLSCQTLSYSTEISEIQSKCHRTAIVKQLRLFLDDCGLIRCSGRIHNATLKDDTKFPYLLPKKHYLTRLIVIDAHNIQLHSGINSTVTQLRQKYWIPAIRQCVKSVLRKCVICRRVNGRPYRAPVTPPLPKIRVKETPPFSVTGVDFTGALHIKDNTRSDPKVYICLFTCATTRAVHLEVVPDLSTDSFLQAFRRFVSRKSLPNVMISDNATTYMSASNYLKKLFESASVREMLHRRGTEWKFIPSRAPWYGGFWERLIGLTKVSLKKLLGRARINLETLQTIITEIEAIMNDRPLTYISSNLDDPEPLTPAHLLYGRRITSLPYADNETETYSQPSYIEPSKLSKRAKFLATTIQHFWKRWKSEYLTSLREHHQTTGCNTQNVKVGDVVQIHDDCPRIRWKLAVIEELLPGYDGFTRSAKVRTQNGISIRPVLKLYPLEVIDDCENA